MQSIDDAVRNWKRPSERCKLARLFEHSTMKKACAATLRANPPVGQLPVNQGVLLIARTFVDMQQHRHTADYDGSTKWTRTDAKEKVDSVAIAFRSLKAIRHEPAAQDFLVSLLLKER